jgi:sec-independent protein translocase protein TatA
MGLGWKELLIVLVIVLIVFGTKKLKNLGGDLGGAIRGFKKGVSGEDEAKPDAERAAPDPGLRDDSRKD